MQSYIPTYYKEVLYMKLKDVSSWLYQLFAFPHSKVYFDAYF